MKIEFELVEHYKNVKTYFVKEIFKIVIWGTIHYSCVESIMVSISSKWELEFIDKAKIILKKMMWSISNFLNQYYLMKA